MTKILPKILLFAVMVMIVLALIPLWIERQRPSSVPQEMALDLPSELPSAATVQAKADLAREAEDAEASLPIELDLAQNESASSPSPAVSASSDQSSEAMPRAANTQAKESTVSEGPKTKDRQAVAPEDLIQPQDNLQDDIETSPPSSPESSLKVKPSSSIADRNSKNQASQHASRSVRGTSSSASNASKIAPSKKEILAWHALAPRIQLGAFEDAHYANRLALELRRQGFDAHIERIEVGSKIQLSRVYVQAQSGETLATLKDRLQSHGHRGIAVIGTALG